MEVATIKLLFFLLFLSTVAVAQAQDSYDSLRDRWLSSLPTSVRDRMDSYREVGIKRYALAMEGVTPDKLRQLATKGVDMRAVDKNPSKKDYEHLAVVFECIAVGTITQVLSDTTDSACFHTQLKIEVQEFLRTPNQIKPDTQLTVVLRSGKLSGGKQLKVSHEFVPEVGSKYILFLSNHGLRYAIALSQRNCRFQITENVFNISERSPRVVGNEVWIPESKERVPIKEFLGRIKPDVRIIAN